MTVPVDVWLRGTNHATTVKLEGVVRDPTGAVIAGAAGETGGEGELARRRMGAHRREREEVVEAEDPAEREGTERQD